MSKLTYGDFRRTGEQDFGNAGDVAEVLELSDSPVDAVEIKRRELDDEREDWIYQQDGEFDDLDPNKAFDAWLDGWIGSLTYALKSEQAMPKSGTGGIGPNQWIAIRQQRAASGVWGAGGEEAFEREAFVRNAILEQIKHDIGELAPGDSYLPELTEYESAILARPGIVRSGQDPAMAFFVGTGGKKPEATTVYVLDDDVTELKARDLFGTVQRVRRSVVARLENATGVRWESGVNIGSPGRQRRVRDVPWFRDLEQPIAKRNPKSTLASSSWTTARDKLRSAVATTKKNPDDPDYIAIGGRADDPDPPDDYIVTLGDRVQVTPLGGAIGEIVELPKRPYRPATFRVKVRVDGDVFTYHADDLLPVGTTARARVMNPSELAKGTAIELEHTSSRARAKKIAMDHLADHPDYYSRLERCFAGNPASAQLEDAKAKYEEFHAKKPTKVGEFASAFSIPSTIGELGKAIHVLYRSDKKDPVTKKQAKNPVDYIHEHYAGVNAYACDDELEQCEVPAFIQDADALVLLGLCLGFRFEDDGGEHDAEGSDPLPELYATPCGKALIVVQSKKEVLAMIWGGGLGVWARGIDG